MQRLEVSGAVRPLYGSLGVKGLIINLMTHLYNLTAPTYSAKTVNVKFALYTSLSYMGKWKYSSTHS